MKIVVIVLLIAAAVIILVRYVRAGEGAGNFKDILAIAALGVSAASPLLHCLKT